MSTERSKDKSDEFKVTFWGTRGTLATPDSQCTKAGGNTVCVEVQCGDQTIICDAGTGIRLLGSRIIEDNVPGKLNILISHAHYDHVEGIPFFAPLFSDRYSVDFWCGELDGSKDTRDTIEGFMRRPYFPVGPDVFLAKLDYHLVSTRQSFNLDQSVRVKTIPLNHPGGATAYRIECGGKSFSYVTDTEHKPGETNQSIVDFIEGTDMFVYDASLTDDELPSFTGYGHSTWEEGLRLAKLAKVKRYFAFHHMPFRCDRDLDKFDTAIKKELPGSGIARENVSIIL